MIPVVCFVGTSQSGKTTLVCQVVAELTARGYRVATVKHHHGEFEIDHEGKDSYRHREAGAGTAIVSSPTQVAMVRRVQAEMTLDRLAGELAADADIMICEGYKKGTAPKIEVWRQGQPDETLVCEGDPQWVALATDFPHNVEVPVLDINWPEQVADFIERRFLCESRSSNVRLLLDDRRVSLLPDEAKKIEDAVRKALEDLAGDEKPHHINLTID